VQRDLKRAELPLPSFEELNKRGLIVFLIIFEGMNTHRIRNKRYAIISSSSKVSHIILGGDTQSWIRLDRNDKLLTFVADYPSWKKAMEKPKKAIKKAMLLCTVQCTCTMYVYSVRVQCTCTVYTSDHFVCKI
jgi:hypothetical protein